MEKGADNQKKCCHYNAFDFSHACGEVFEIMMTLLWLNFASGDICIFFKTFWHFRGCSVRALFGLATHIVEGFQTLQLKRFMD